MQISFIIVFMIDLNKDNYVRACVRECVYNYVCACVCAFVNFFFKKTAQKLLTGLLPVKIFSSSLQKNQACGAIQVLKRL